MKKKNEKLLKYIIGICIFILVIEAFVFIFSLFREKKTFYFDGVNAIRKNEHYYVVVGSNNDNDLHYEKAKLSIYNNDREKILEKLYNVGFNSAFFGVCLEENNLVAVGSYEKTEKEHQDSIRSAFIVKYDYDGNIIFEQSFQLLDNSKFTGIVSVDDGYYVIGQSVYKSTRVGNDQGGAILVKYDKEGNLEWYRTIGSSKDGIFHDLCVVGDSIYVVGLKESGIGLICKYQVDGNLIFEKEFDDMDDIGFSGIIQVGDFYYTGGSKKTDHGVEAYLLKLSDDGSVVNSVSYDKVLNARFQRLVFDEDDSIAVIGSHYLEKKPTGSTVDYYNYDGLIVKYNLDLEFITSVTYGDDGDDYFTDIIYENGYLVAGYSSYEDGSYYSKFIRYSDALKVLGVEK